MEPQEQSHPHNPLEVDHAALDQISNQIAEEEGHHPDEYELFDGIRVPDQVRTSEPLPLEPDEAAMFEPSMFQKP
jgi:hypothetical protein